MFWFIIIIGVVVVLVKFGTALQEDKKDIRVNDNLATKFQVVVDSLNEKVFSGNGKITMLDNKSFNLYDGYNQIIYFYYSTGHLTITWKYKYYQKEVVHEKIFENVRNISILEQQKIVNTICNEMSEIVEKHKMKVMTGM